MNVLSELEPPQRERGDDYLVIARRIFARGLPPHPAGEETGFLRVLDR